MSLETGDINKLRAKPKVEGHESEVEFETTKADLTQPDSLISEVDAGSPSATGAVPEHLAVKTTEESETEFEANMHHLLLASKDAESPSDTVTEQEHLGNGERKELKMEESAFEVASADLDVSNFLTDSRDVVTLSYRDAVLEHLEDGVGEEPKTEELAAEVASTDLVAPDSLTDNNDTVNLSDLATSTDCSAMQPTGEATKEEDDVEDLVIDTGFGDAVEVVPNGADEVQVAPGNAIQKNESKSIFENTDESESTPILDGAAGDLSSSKQLPLKGEENVIHLQCESIAPDAPNGEVRCK